MTGPTVAVMQPYFFPYAGYFRLLAAADVFVIYDCVQFPRRGRVHRCEVTGLSGETQWLTLPLAHQPRDVLIRDLAFAVNARAELDRERALAAQAKADADAKVAKDAKEAAKREAAKNPPRVWVQVATGANEAGLPSTWKRIREKSPLLFKGLSAASVPFKSTNRLLVGPIKSQAEARALVNALQKAGMAGTTYSSEAGQEIARIASK